MPKIHGRNTVLELYDSSGASSTVSGDLNNVTFSWTRNNPDVSVFGNDGKQRISGLKDYNFQCTAIYNSDTASAIQSSLAAYMSSSTVTVFKWYPAGKTTGCEFWTGCTLMSAYSETAGVDDAVRISFTLEAGSGSLSASTV